MAYNQVPPTPHGYDRYEAISAMQKCIRRGAESDAMAFALSLSMAGMFKAAANRIRVTAQEDIGLGDMDGVNFAINSLNQAEAWYQQGNDAWRLGLANAIMALSRANKSRGADNFVAAVRHRLIHESLRPEMPDFALDKHTRRGKKMGRGMKHFLEEGAKLFPPPMPCPYEEDAHAFWLGNEEKMEPNTPMPRRQQYNNRPQEAPPEAKEHGPSSHTKELF